MDAAEFIKPVVTAMCAEVLDCIKGSPTPEGYCCDEVEVLLGMKHQTCSARFRDLKLCDPPLIVKARTPEGKHIRHGTRSGCTAGAWIANPELAS